MKNVSEPQYVGPVKQALLDRVRDVFENDFILYDAIMRKPKGVLRVQDYGIAEICQ